jgi:CDGSH-type Zn-finger protein
MTNDASPAAEQHRVVTIKTVDNGPLQIKGPIRLVDHDGTDYDLGGRRTAFLCRCGRSRTKPFCDGTHARVDFTAEQRASSPEEGEQ